jgi:ABC-type polysaccharide/polyol phosphate export permease
VQTVLELTGESTPVRTLLVDAGRSWRLVPMLARQDFSARYRSAALGLVWSVALPLLQAAVVAVVFTHVVRVGDGTGSYAAFVIVGTTTWSYVQSSFATGSTCIVDAGALASKVYFPRLLLSAVSASANAVGFAISMVVGLSAALVLGARPGFHVLMLPVAVTVAYALVVLSSALAALLHVHFRDIRYSVTALLLVLFYATPVIYPPHLAGRAARYLDLNPVTGVVQLTRWSVLGEAERVGSSVLSTCIWLVVLTVVVLLAYRRHERIALDKL